MTESGVDTVGVFLSNPFTAERDVENIGQIHPRPRLTSDPRLPAPLHFSPTRKLKGDTDMELDPTRTAVIAVHLQKDVVSADGAFGGFFAAQAVERDVVGVNSTTARRRPPRRRHRRLHPRRLATRLGRPDRQLPHPADRPTIRVPGRRQRQGADPRRAHPAGHRPGRHPPAGRRVLRQPTGPSAPQPRHRHRPVHRGRHQLLRRRHRHGKPPTSATAPSSSPTPAAPQTPPPTTPPLRRSVCSPRSPPAPKFSKPCR